MNEGRQVVLVSENTGLDHHPVATIEHRSHVCDGERVKR